MHHLEVSYLLGLPAERRERIRLFYGHFPFVVTEMLGTDLVTITVLRDPVERTISLLRVLREQREAWRDLTLDQIYDDDNMFPRLIHNHQTKLFSITAADRPQSYRDEIAVDGARLRLAKQNLDARRSDRAHGAVRRVPRDGPGPVRVAAQRTDALERGRGRPRRVRRPPRPDRGRQRDRHRVLRVRPRARERAARLSSCTRPRRRCRHSRRAVRRRTDMRSSSASSRCPSPILGCTYARSCSFSTHAGTCTGCGPAARTAGPR